MGYFRVISFWQKEFGGSLRSEVANTPPRSFCQMGQYKTWTLDSGLDSGLDSSSGLNNRLAFRLEFQSLEVKQQRFEYSISLTPVAKHVFNYTRPFACTNYLFSPFVPSVE